jgi:acyl carrier protein
MEVSKDVQNFIKQNFYAAQKLDIAPDDSLLDNGIIDSTGVLELVSFLEGRYNVTVDDSEMVPENLDSIAAIVRFLQGKGVA